MSPDSGQTKCINYPYFQNKFYPQFQIQFLSPLPSQFYPTSATHSIPISQLGIECVSVVKAILIFFNFLSPLQLRFLYDLSIHFQCIFAEHLCALTAVPLSARGKPSQERVSPTSKNSLLSCNMRMSTSSALLLLSATDCQCLGKSSKCN